MFGPTICFYFISLLLISTSEEYRPPKTTDKNVCTTTVTKITTITKGSPTSTTTPSPTTSCYEPNMTLAIYPCQCQPVCDFGTMCPSGCRIAVDTYIYEPLKCVCAEQYVLDLNLDRCIHASDCHCKAPNEEFKTCIGPLEPSCADPNRINTKQCDVYSSRCVCKEGYLRNAIGVCVPKNSDECALEGTTTTPPTTTPDNREKIQCLNGSIFVANCSWYSDINSTDYKKCVERQKQREKDAFQPILCDPGVTQCFDLRHNCFTINATKHMKGCGSTWGGLKFDICDQSFYGQCLGGDGSTYKCRTCEGNLCNKGDIPYTTTTTTTATYSIPPSHRTTTTGTYSSSAASTTTTDHSITKTTINTKNYPYAATTTPTTICYEPNTTLVNFSCQSQPLCGYGGISPSSCYSYATMNVPRKCICAKDYVLDPHNLTRCMHASECQCRAPNEEFKRCIAEQPSCLHPDRNYTINCGNPAMYSKCVCKDGYLRDSTGVCIPKNSYECKMAGTTTTPPPPTTTTTLYHERIYCNSGSMLVVDCSRYADVNSTDYNRCEEYQKQRENDAFRPILCDQGVTQCYDLRHSCYVLDVSKHMKGCGRTWGFSAPGLFGIPGICNEVWARECPGGDYNRLKCAVCEGNLCNKDDLPYDSTITTETYSTRPTMTTSNKEATTTKSDQEG